MEENKYYIENNEGEGMACEPSPTYRSVVAERVCSRDKEDSYPMGRSFAQVKAHCESLLDKLEDTNFGRPIEELNAEIDKMIAEWN